MLVKTVSLIIEVVEGIAFSIAYVKIEIVSLVIITPNNHLILLKKGICIYNSKQVNRALFK